MKIRKSNGTKSGSLQSYLVSVPKETLSEHTRWVPTPLRTDFDLMRVGREHDGHPQRRNPGDAAGIHRPNEQRAAVGVGRARGRAVQGCGGPLERRVDAALPRPAPIAETIRHNEAVLQEAGQNHAHHIAAAGGDL